MNEDKAALFVAMAERIRAVADGEFAGAILIVPPGEGGALTMLSIDPDQNPAHFWNAAKARLDIAHAEFSENQRNAGGMFGGRR